MTNIKPDWMPTPFVDFPPGEKYLNWLEKVALILQCPIEPLKTDESWFWCFDDGMTPEKAVREFRSHFANGDG